MAAEWFCKIGEKKVGPLNNQQLIIIVARGQLKPEHLVRRGSEGPWVPAGRIKGLFNAGGAGPAPSQDKPPQNKTPQNKTAAKPLPSAAGAGLLPAAAQPPLPPANIPSEFAPGPQHKHHVELNFDKLHIETAPVMVSRRKMKSGLQSLKAAQQKKAATILLTVIGGGAVIGVLIFVVAFAKGMFSSSPPEPKNVFAESTASDSAAKPPGEKKPAEAKTQEAQWPANWNKVSVQETAVGDAVVLVLKPRRGPPPKEIKITDKEVLVVPVNLQLKQGVKKNIPLTSWADEKLKKSVFLKDDPREGMGQTFELLGVVPRAGDDASQVSAQADSTASHFRGARDDCQDDVHRFARRGFGSPRARRSPTSSTPATLATGLPRVASRAPRPAVNRERSRRAHAAAFQRRVRDSRGTGGSSRGRAGASARRGPGAALGPRVAAAARGDEVEPVRQRLRVSLDAGRHGALAVALGLGHRRRVAGAIVVANAIGRSSPAAGGAMSSFGIVIGSVLTGLGGIVFGAVFAALASIHGLTILTETAAGNDRIESWPNIGLFLEWFCNLFYVINAAALSAALACALGALVPPARGAVIGVVEFLVFPFLLMSELEANSAFMPVSQLVFASLWRQARPWTSFYVQSGCLLVAAVALPVLASPHIDSRLGVVFGGLIVAAVAMIYFRLLGRLAWHCSIEKEDDAAPEQEITEESTVEEGTFEQRPVKP